MRMTWKQSMRQGSPEVKMDITAEYVRFGVPVDIDVPDDGDASLGASATTCRSPGRGTTSRC